RKVVQQEELVARSAEMRGKGQILVLTNGCFDLLHLGHVRYLEQARALGDALAVGVNTDASVRRLKGPDRPVTPQNDRAEILAGLAAVDFVVLFDEETAAELVGAVKPMLYVKGGDYSADPESEHFPVEGHAVRAYGGETRIVDLVPGHSSSRVLEERNFSRS
ncbi:MAG: adenylyltransferase/cytidyltransferase family protein, partial [Chloroflexota bacterium]